MVQQLPRILRLLQDKADVSISMIGEERGFGLYEADLTEWRLRFSEKSPFIVIGEQDVSESLDQVWDAILELAITRGWEDLIPIVLVEGHNEELKRRASLSRETWFSIAVLDDDVAKDMENARSARYPVLDALLVQIPRRLLLPYQTAAPVTGSAFFGRQSEVDRLIKSEESYAITGVRRIGKTSLLLEARRRAAVREHVVFLTCSTIHSHDEFVREVIRALRRTELRHLKHHLFHFPDFLKRMPDYKKGRITLFLDEVDDLLEMDRKTGYPIFNALRDARTSTDKRWRFIMAGSSYLEDECARQASPLFNMVQAMPLGPFNRRQAAALITQPFEGIRIGIANRNELIDRIYRETGGHPNLIQHYCVLLAGLLDEEERDTIDLDDLNQVYASRTFRDYVLRSFEINTGPMERLVVCLEAHQDTFTQKDIDTALKERGITASFTQINGACANLEAVAVLRKIGRHYQFALPLLPSMLEQNYDLDYLVTKAREELRR